VCVPWVGSALHVRVYVYVNVGLKDGGAGMGSHGGPFQVVTGEKGGC
jgi:hypothetical protein